MHHSPCPAARAPAPAVLAAPRATPPPTDKFKLLLVQLLMSKRGVCSSSGHALRFHRRFSRAPCRILVGKNQQIWGGQGMMTRRFYLYRCTSLGVATTQRFGHSLRGRPPTGGAVTNSRELFLKTLKKNKFQSPNTPKVASKGKGTKRVNRPPRFCVFHRPPHFCFMKCLKQIYRL